MRSGGGKSGVAGDAGAVSCKSAGKQSDGGAVQKRFIASFTVHLLLLLLLLFALCADLASDSLTGTCTLMLGEWCRLLSPSPSLE